MQPESKRTPRARRWKQYAGQEDSALPVMMGIGTSTPPSVDTTVFVDAAA